MRNSQSFQVVPLKLLSLHLRQKRKYTRHILDLIFSYLEPNKLAFYYFMDAGRSHEARVLETMDFIIHCTAGIKTIEFALVPLNPKSSGGDGEGLNGCLHI